MAIPVYQVDAFTNRPFAGNPAAVTLFPEPRPDDWMQALAQEMNLSETAFLVPEGDGYRLRWFTPATEVDLCGHATLASAHILWERRYLPEDEPAIFETRSGRLTCYLEGDWIRMDFPARPVQELEPPEGLLAALGLEQAAYVGAYERDYLIELADEQAVRGLQPDFVALQQLPKRAVIVTAPAESGEYDFVSRFFAPAMGVPEDPVTGSAHCALLPYWAGKLGRSELRAFQASARGGELRLRLSPDGSRAELLGQACTVMVGELMES